MQEDISQRILDTSAHLFLKYGIKSITMDDISRELSMSKKTVYQFFKDKNEIVCRVAAEYLEYEKHKFEAIHEESGNAIERLFGYSQCIRELFDRMNPVVLYDLKKYYAEAWKMYLNYKRDIFYKSIINTLILGIRQGYFRNDIDVDILATLRLEETQLSFDEDIFPSNRFDFRKVQFQLFDHFVYGIVTEKGYTTLKNRFKNA